MLIFAHRGASNEAPENTLSAIQHALDQKADGIEIDVFQIEQELVLIHDKWLSRTTNGSGQLEDYSFNELQTLDAGNGQQVPTLWQVLEMVRGQCQVNIEIKGVEDLSLVCINIDKAVNQLNFKPDDFIVSSFNHYLLAEFKKRMPRIKIGALTGNIPIGYAQFAEDLHAFSVNVDASFIDKQFVDDAHRRGLKIFVYTVDEPVELLRLKRWGVDGVFSNSPAKAKLVIQNHQE